MHTLGAQIYNKNEQYTALFHVHGMLIKPVVKSLEVFLLALYDFLEHHIHRQRASELHGDKMMPLWEDQHCR
jgi:hypothetical protein